MQIEYAPCSEERMSEARHSVLCIGRDPGAEGNEHRTIASGAKSHALAILAREKARAHHLACESVIGCKSSLILLRWGRWGRRGLETGRSDV